MLSRLLLINLSLLLWYTLSFHTVAFIQISCFSSFSHSFVVCVHSLLVNKKSLMRRLFRLLTRLLPDTSNDNEEGVKSIINIGEFLCVTSNELLGTSLSHQNQINFPNHLNSMYWENWNEQAGGSAGIYEVIPSCVCIEFWFFKFHIS